MRWLLFFSLLPLISFAQVIDTTHYGLAAPTVAPVEPNCPTPHKCEECAREFGQTEKYRKDSFGTVMVSYQYVSTWVVGKMGASYTQIANREWSFELEYVTSERTPTIGNFELGKIKEDRYTLFGKYYLNNSFHFSFGPYFYQYEIHTAGSIKNLANQDFKQTWNLTGLGAAFAFGNRWQTNWGLTYGVDWVRMNYPFVTTWLNKNTGETDTTTRKEANNSFELLRKIPTFVFFGISVGYAF